MYKEDILDLYKNPRNQGSLKNSIRKEGENPSCGDHLQIYVKVEDGEIKDIKHESEGCTISTAATSILTEEVKGKKVGEVMKLDKDWMVEKLGIDISPMRMKCALLGLETVQKALNEDSGFNQDN